MSSADESANASEKNTPETVSTHGEVVGYGRPPRHSQFKKGVSGNPRGRPKGSKNFSTYLDEELRQPVTVTEGGTRKRIPKAKAIAKRVVNGAVSGETKMVPMLLNYDRLQADQKAAESPLEIPLSEDDEIVFRTIVERIRIAEQAPELPPPLGSDDVAARSGDHGPDPAQDQQL